MGFYLKNDVSLSYVATWYSFNGTYYLYNIKVFDNMIYLSLLKMSRILQIS